MQIIGDALRSLQVSIVTVQDTAERIDAQILALHLHNLLIVRVFPIAISGVLIDAAPNRIEQVELGTQRLPGALLRILVSLQSEIHGILYAVPIEEFLVGSPCTIFSIV